MSELIFRSDTRQRKWRFIAKSFSHPAKMSLPLQLWLIEHYSKPGDWILDPMAGSGTLLVACSLSRNVILVELEDKFCKMAEENWARVKEVGCELGHTMGQAIIKQGDARDLERVLSGADDKARASQRRSLIPPNSAPDIIVTSPPFSSMIDKRIERDKFFDKAEEIFNRQYLKSRDSFTQGQPENPDNIDSLPYGNPDLIITSPPYADSPGTPSLGSVNKDDWGNEGTDIVARRGLEKGYSKDTKGQIGQLPYGSIDVVVSSPPYSGAVSSEKSGIDWSKGTRGETEGYKPRDKSKEPAFGHSPIGGAEWSYGKTEGQIGNLKSDTYLEAMKQVYAQCWKILKPNGLMVLVTKNFIRNKAIVPLNEHTIKLCESVGFKLIERHYRKLTAQGFWRIIYQSKYPEAPKIEKEDILVFGKN